MKRKGLFLVTLILAICMVSQTMVLAAWEPYYGGQYVSGDVVRVQKSWNDAGQTVYAGYNAYGNLIIDIRAREGNIWNETTQVLYTSTNKGPEFVGISQELDVYGINYTGNPMKYRNGFQNGEVPYVLSDVYATALQTNSSGVVIGVYTNYGVYNFQDDNYNNNFNDYYYNDTNYNSAYPKVVQNGNEYYYYYSSNRYYTYKYNPSTKYLSYNNSKLSNISEIAFAPGYLFAVTTSNKVYQIRIGSLQKEETFNNYFREWMYSNSYWVNGYVDNYGNDHYFSVNYNNYLDGDDYYYHDDEYPYVVQEGTKYTYYATYNRKYTYTLSTSGKLSYNGTTIDTDVEQVEFSQGYLVYVDENLNVYKVQLGYTAEIFVCSYFREFEYDNKGFVYEVNNSSRNYAL